MNEEDMNTISETLIPLKEKLNNKSIGILVYDKDRIDEYHLKACIILASKTPLTKHAIDVIMGMEIP